MKIREIGLERNVGENFGQKFSKQIYLLPSSRLKIENETRRKFERGTFKKKARDNKKAIKLQNRAKR